MTVKAKEHYAAIRKFIKWAKSVNIPIHEQRRWEIKNDSFMDGVWLEPDGIHFVRGQLKAGDLAHEAGHWALIHERDRPNLKSGDLSLLEIGTCFSEVGAEAWAIAVWKHLNLPFEIYYDDLRLYKHIREKFPPDTDDDMIILSLGVKTIQEPTKGEEILEFSGIGPKTGIWTATEKAWQIWNDMSGDVRSL